MPEPGTKIKIDGKAYVYPKLVSRKETLCRLQEAKKNRVLTPGLKVVDEIGKIIIEADYGWPNDLKEVIKKIEEE